MLNTVQVLHQGRGVCSPVPVQGPLPAHQSHRSSQFLTGTSGTVTLSGTTITTSATPYPDNVLTILRSERDFWGQDPLPGITQDCWRWSSWDRTSCAPQKLSVQQDTAPPEPAPLHPQPEESLAEVRAAPAPAESPGRQLQLPGKQRARLGRKIKKEQFKALAAGRPKRPQTCVSPW